MLNPRTRLTRPDGSGEFFIEGSIERSLFLVRADGPRAWMIQPGKPARRREDRLAELAWDTSGIEVSRDQARLIAGSWGASIPASPAEWPGDETRGTPPSAPNWRSPGNTS
jgi:hypothetical protein